jgi:protease-4
MRKFLGKLLAWIGGIVVVVIALIALAIYNFRPQAKTVAGNTIIELDLTAPVVEEMPEDPLSQLQGQNRRTLRGLVFGLEKASKDPKVKGLIARVGESPLMPAQADELRQAILDFRSKGKFAIAYAEAFGDGNSALASYYLASACDEIALKPQSFFGVAGFRFELPFLRGTLDKLGIVPHFEGRKEYKSAIEQYLNKQMSPPAREAMDRLIQSIYTQYVSGIAQGRKLSPERVRELIDKAPMLGQEALDAKLVDTLAYRDEVYDRAKKRAGKDSSLLFFSHYQERAAPIHSSGQRIALIYGVGAINSGKSGFDPLQGELTMGSDTVGKAIRLAADDAAVKAIIFRVDSPGGSAVASDVIWREIARARKAGKPVVVSMGGLAASGGYWVSMGADKIVALPSTITGSIGVFSGKLITKGGWDKVGVSFDAAQAGRNADMNDSNKDFTPDQLAHLRAELDNIYDNFTSKVAEGRKLSKDRVLDVARGRVWSGADAKERGLVDEIGGLQTAVRIAKQLGKIKDTDEIELKLYPPRKTRAEIIMALLQGEEPENSESAELAALSRFYETARPLARTLARAGLMGRARGEVELPALGW